jgi:predicted amidohydrolase YtcJ
LFCLLLWWWKGLALSCPRKYVEWQPPEIDTARELFHKKLPVPADLVVYGTVLTVDEGRPSAEALAVTDGRIVAVGTRADVAPHVGPGTEVVELDDGCVMPGFVEAHGHPLMEAVVLSDRLVDIRPVIMRDPDQVLAAITNEIAVRGASGAYLNGWDPLLQEG